MAALDGHLVESQTGAGEGVGPVVGIDDHELHVGAGMDLHPVGHQPVMADQGLDQFQLTEPSVVGRDLLDLRVGKLLAQEIHALLGLQRGADCPLAAAAVVGADSDTALGIGTMTRDAADPAGGDKDLAALLDRHLV